MFAVLSDWSEFVGASNVHQDPFSDSGFLSAWERYLKRALMEIRPSGSRKLIEPRRNCLSLQEGTGLASFPRTRQKDAMNWVTALTHSNQGSMRKQAIFPWRNSPIVEREQYSYSPGLLSFCIPSFMYLRGDYRKYSYWK